MEQEEAKLGAAEASLSVDAVLGARLEYSMDVYSGDTRAGKQESVPTTLDSFTLLYTILLYSI